MVKLFNVWVIFTLLGFYFGPLEWPSASSYLVFFYVLACLAAFNLGKFAFDRVNPGPAIELVPENFLRGTAAPLTVLILYVLFDNYYFYQLTGKTILETNIFSATSSIYNAYVISIFESAPRTPLGLLVLIIRSILYILVLCVFFQNFRNKLFFYGCLLALISGTLFRGTNKEALDVLTLLMVGFYYFGDKRKVIIAVFGGAVAFVVLFYFLISQRFDGNLLACSALVNMCVDQEGFLYSISPSAAEALFFLMTYLTQGYEGLSRAFFLDYDFTYGIGHLPVLYNFVCGPETCGETFQQKLQFVGWNTKYFWTSVYTVIANDFHWIFSPVYFFLLGGMFSWLERAWKEKRGAGTLIGLYLIAIFWIYSSANMQVAGSFNLFLGWCLFVYAPFAIHLLKAVLRSRQFAH